MPVTDADGLTFLTDPAALRAGFNAETATLENGLEVVALPNRRAPVVSHWLWYRVGTADSPPGKSGLPHFLEHLMFKGTRSLAPGEFSKVVARHGGNENAMTSYDFTTYFQTIAKDRLSLMMEMEADRMANLTLADDQVYPERDVILEERKQRIDNEPSSLLGEQLAAAQWLHHPYRLPVIGWEHEIASYTREDAEAFYEAWYTPNNAVLIVAGDITMAELRPLAERHYGAVEPRRLPDRRRHVEPPQHAARRLVLEDPRVRQPSVVRSYLAPSFTAGGGDAHALEVLSEILGGGGSSRLHRALVVDQALAAGVGAFYRGTSLDATSFRFYATPRPGVSTEALERGLDAEIARVVTDGVSDDELARTKNRMLAQAVYARDSLGGLARLFGSWLTTGLAAADLESWPFRVNAITGADVAAAARALVRPERSVTAHLLPAGAAT